MAKLPSAADFNRATPQPGRGITSYQTGQVESAQYEQGNLIGNIGEMFSKESDRLASVQAEDGLNKIKQARLDLQMGDKGFMNLRGGDVVNRPILKEYPDQFKSQIDEIVNQMPNSMAKEKLLSASKSEMLGFQSGLLRHSMAESDKHELSTANATLSMAAQTGSAQWSNPVEVANQYQTGVSRIDSLSARLGHDPVETLVMKQKFASQYHEAVLQSAIAGKDLAYAENYYKEHAQDLSTADQVKYSHYLTGERNKLDANDAAARVVTKSVASAYPSDNERAWSITKTSESGGRQFKSYGTRADGTQKGEGFMGELKRPDGKVSTEISVGVNIDGKEVEIPTLVPTLSKQEINSLLNGDKPSDAILKKAVDHAKSRMDEGKSPFADRKPLTSSAGAIGIAQVMPGTGPEAAKLAGLPWDEARFKNDPAYNEAIGKAYFEQQVRSNNGDLPKAWASYNAGPGRTQAAVEFAQLLKENNGNPDAANAAAVMSKSAAVKKYAPSMAQAARNLTAEQRGEWINLLPPETQAYVAKNQQAYNSGGGAQGMPSLMAVKQQVADDLKGKPPEVIALAQTKAESQLNDWKQDRSQRQDQAMNEIMRGIETGTIKDFEDIPGSAKGFLDYKDRHGIQSYIKSAGKSADSVLELSPAATGFYYELLTDPIALKKSSIPDIMKMSGNIGQNRVNDLLQKRASYLNQPEKEAAATIDSDQFKAAAATWGFKPKNDTHKAQLVQAKDRIEMQITQEQAETGKTLSRERKGQIIDMNLGRMNVEEPGMLWGTNINERRGFEVKRAADIRIPENYRKAAMSSGLQFSEQQLLAAYVADQKKASRK